MSSLSANCLNIDEQKISGWNGPPFWNSRIIFCASLYFANRNTSPPLFGNRQPNSRHHHCPFIIHVCIILISLELCWIIRGVLQILNYTRCNQQQPTEDWISANCHATNYHLSVIVFVCVFNWIIRANYAAGETHLYPILGQVRFEGEHLASVNVRVMGLFERLL